MHIFKKLLLGLFTLCFIMTAAVVAQLQNNSHAASTLSGNNEVLPISTTDGQPLSSSDTLITSVSQDGNVVLFTTTSPNIVNAGGSGYDIFGGIYSYNFQTNTTTRIDTSASGMLPSKSGGIARMSENGRYVFFMSPATNLIDGSTQYDRQLYMRDLQLGTIVAITNDFATSTQHYVPQLTTQDYPISVSNDGRFTLLASRYTGVNYPYNYNIMLGDRKTGSFTWTSLGQAFANTTTDPTNGGMSCDGSFVAYEKSGGIYTVDTRNGVTPATTLASGASVSALVSCNGNYVLYATTNRTDISPTPTGLSQYMHLVEYNRLTGTRQYIDKNSSGGFDSNHISYSSSSYSSQPENLFSASVADSGDVVFKYNGNFYIKHLSDGSGTLESVAKAPNGTYVNVSQSAKITGDGRYVFFVADPYDLGLTPSASGPQIIRAKTGI